MDFVRFLDQGIVVNKVSINVKVCCIVLNVITQRMHLEIFR